MDSFTQSVKLQSGETVTAQGRVLRAWGGDIVAQIAEGGYHSSGAPLTGDEIREINDALRPKSTASGRPE